MKVPASNYHWDCGDTFVDADGQAWLIPDGQDSEDSHHLFHCAIAYKGQRSGHIIHLSRITIEVADDISPNIVKL